MSKFDILKEIRSYLTRTSFKGITLIDGKETGVEIEYIPQDIMKLKGLKPDLPPYLRLKPYKIEASEDSTTWNEIELETGLLILYILDVRILLTEGAYRLLKTRETSDGEEFIVEYDLESLNKMKIIYLPNDVLRLMKEHGESKRPVKIYISNGKLVKMVQKELPPSNQELTVLFKY